MNYSTVQNVHILCQIVYIADIVIVVGFYKNLNCVKTVRKCTTLYGLFEIVHCCIQLLINMLKAMKAVVH